MNMLKLKKNSDVLLNNADFVSDQFSGEACGVRRNLNRIVGEIKTSSLTECYTQKPILIKVSQN